MTWDSQRDWTHSGLGPGYVNKKTEFTMAHLGYLVVPQDHTSATVILSQILPSPHPFSTDPPIGTMLSLDAPWGVKTEPCDVLGTQVWFWSAMRHCMCLSEHPAAWL